MRVTNADRRGYIEFQFALDDPTIYLEMTLPPAAFAEFCQRHDARLLTRAEAAAVDAAAAKWRFGNEEKE